MRLLFQDPENEDTDYLLESLLQASESASEGGAMFSFASAVGATMLLKDSVFQDFAAGAKFDLIVGVDAVTNVAALTAIDDALSGFGGVSGRVFLHDRPMTLFHPKLCWFSRGDEGFAIVGSGNLTMGGLRSNWEAYAIHDLEAGSVDEIRQAWCAWVERHEAALLPLNDDRVLERASKNTGWAPLGDRRSKQPNEADDIPEEDEVERVQTANEVLIAEIPRGGDRWHQANFDVDNYENFFGARLGTQRRMIFQHVSPTGNLGELEIRPSIAVASKNYRFEIGAAAGQPYPSEGPPIGVFIRVAVRTFRYALLMPTEPGYSEVSDVLDQKWDGPEREMRRVRLDAEELALGWPTSSLLADPGGDSA